MSDRPRIAGGVSCPLPITDSTVVQLAHGGGGTLSRRLVEGLFLPELANPLLASLHDGAVLEVGAERLAFSTDTFVVSPLFFPGGDIGSLAVHGTVNDLAMCGARPLALSAGFVLEEGLPMDDLARIVRSMAAAARASGVTVVTGDTKVVDRGKGDGLFVNTTGLGIVQPGIEIAATRARPGDVVIVSGEIAVHGIAILAVREGFEFETPIETDSAPLWELVRRLLDSAGPAVHVLRDPTRGGVASALNEIAATAVAGIEIEEAAIPVSEPIRGACEILGFDPLQVANEGKLVAIVAPEVAEAALEALRGHPLGGKAAIVGRVVEDHPSQVVLASRIGGRRIVEMLSGEQLPRIC